MVRCDETDRAQEVFLAHTIHPERFRSNTQNAIVCARRNRPHVNRSDEFACICDRPHARACVSIYVHDVTPFKEHQIKLRVHA